MKFPIRLYKLNKELISKTEVSKNNCFYFYSYQQLSVKIISGVGILYSVKQVGQSLITNNGQEFNDNFGYTLYIPENDSIVSIEISNNEATDVYTFKLSYDNIITEETEHYNDLLLNNYLPNFKELEPALLEGFDKSDLVKRLLLDFKDIMRYRGTKESIHRFFEFIGYGDQQTNIFTEYKNLSNGAITLLPNKLTDVKTGNYHILYDNYEQIGYDKNNLPERIMIIQDLSKFFESLIYAISLANKYFTIKEQDITFFGINYSSNIAYEPSTTSNMSKIFENDVYDFRKDLHIDFYSFIDSQTKTIMVENCLQRLNINYKSEIKTSNITPIPPAQLASKIYFVDEEIFDDSVVVDESDLQNIKRLFGIVLNLNIVSPNTKVEFEIVNKSNPLFRLKYSETLTNQILNKKIVFIDAVEYSLNIWITDKFNNVEHYFYSFNLSADISKIDFDIFSSTELQSDIVDSLNSDPDSPSIVTTPSGDMVVPLDIIPTDLSDYYNSPILDTTGWLSLNKRYSIPELSKNNKLNLVTETIPLNLLDNWLDVVAFPVVSGNILRLRYFDYDIYQKISMSYHSISDAKIDELFNKLYITIIDIYDPVADAEIPHYLITTTETGIDLNKNMFDFVYSGISIYNLTNVTKARIPVNFDFELFDLESESHPNSLFISNQTQGIKTIVKSIFPRLTNIDLQTKDSYNVYVGDLIMCRLNNDYVVNAKDLVWKVFNSFTKELLFESTDFALKYRINNNTLFDISIDFVIDSQNYQIYKKSILSSFIKKSY